MTYTWKIDMIHSASRGEITDYVTEIHWSKTGVDENGITGRWPGMTRFTFEDAQTAKTSGVFTPLSELSEQQVIDWVRSTLDQESDNFINVKISAEISRKIMQSNDKQESGTTLPWEK